MAAVIANIYYFIYEQVTGNTFAELNLGSITGASVLPGLVGGLILYALHRFTSRGTQIFVIGGALFTIVSIVPTIVAPLYPNFFWASAPLHIIVGAVLLALIPRLAATSR